MKKHMLLTAGVLFIFSISMVSAQNTSPEKKKMKPALLVIDIQNVYLPMMAAEDTTLAMPRINWAVTQFRKMGCPVIRIYHDDPKESPEPGDPAFEFPGHISVTEKDPKIIKNYGDAFHKTELAERLRKLNVNTVFLCGLSATGCVLATYIGAYENDFKVFMIKDAIISPNASHTNSIEEIFDAVSLSTLAFMLEFSGD